MFALLNTRLIAAALVAAFLCFTHFYAYRAGKQNVRTAWELSVAEANTEARRMEQARQANVDTAAVTATKRRVVVVADSRRAADALDGLRHAISTRNVAEESAAAATKRADTAEQLLIESGSAYQELARQADGHVGDVMLLLQAWPK